MDKMKKLYEKSKQYMEKKINDKKEEKIDHQQEKKNFREKTLVE